MPTLVTDPEFGPQTINWSLKNDRNGGEPVPPVPPPPGSTTEHIPNEQRK